MSKNKIILLKDIFPQIQKNYDKEIFDLFLPFLNENIFSFFKNGEFVLFNCYSSKNKIIKLNDLVFKKIIKFQKLNLDDYTSLYEKLSSLYISIASIDNLKKFYRDIIPIFNIKELKLNLSNYCNLHCKYCFQKEKNSKKLTYEQCCNHIDKFMETYKGDTILLTLAMTSEPLLDMPLIKKIYEYLQAKSLERLKQNTSKKELYDFLKISSDEEYNNILLQKDYYKSCFENIDKRFISDALSEKLNLLNYDESDIRSINEEVIYTSLSAFKNSYYLFLNTNGTITPSHEDLLFLKKLYSSAPLGISLDGNYFNNKQRCYTDGKNSYKKVISNIKLFQENGIKLRVNCTITNINNNFLKLNKFFKKLKIDDYNFNLLKGEYSPKTIKNMQKWFRAFENKKIDSLHGLDFSQDFIKTNDICLLNCDACYKKCIGYDNEEHFCDYLTAEKMNTKNILNVLLRDNCKNCPFALVCGGSCFAIKDAIKVKNYCNMRKEIIKQLIFCIS